MAFDITSAATTATNAIKNAVNGSGVVSGLQTAGASLDSLKNAALSGAGNLASSLTNAIPGQLKSIIDIVPKITDFNPKEVNISAEISPVKAPLFA